MREGETGAMNSATRSVFLVHQRNATKLQQSCKRVSKHVGTEGHILIAPGTPN